MNPINKKSLFLFLLLSTTSIVPLAQAGLFDTFKGTASTAWNSTRDFAVSKGTDAYNYVRNAPTVIKSGNAKARLKLGGIAAAAVATPFLVVYLIKKFKAKHNSGSKSS